ncbi:MAG: hypothetical protein H7Y11_05985 [Armatimonadetes bacterium]|nr:hypothetical protein [Anaerolineae bacterium]
MTNPPQNTPNTPPQTQSQGGSFASRLANRLGASQPNQNQAAAQTPASSNAPAQTNTSGTSAPFGSRNANSNRPSAAAPSVPASRQANPFNSGQNQRSWTMQPIYKTVVRFELKGLGDPFYRLLQADLKPEFGDPERVATELERGGEAVQALEVLLSKAWESYRLEGAALLYPWNDEAWETITKPPVAQPQNNDDDDSAAQSAPTLTVQFSCLRAIDLQLVLNVLARARSQVLMTRAPLVFSHTYLTRSLFTDDPRLVALVKATGYLEEG